MDKNVELRRGGISHSSSCKPKIAQRQKLIDGDREHPKSPNQTDNLVSNSKIQVDIVGESSSANPFLVNGAISLTEKKDA